MLKRDSGELFCGYRWRGSFESSKRTQTQSSWM